MEFEQRLSYKEEINLKLWEKVLQGIEKNKSRKTYTELCNLRWEQLIGRIDELNEVSRS